MAWTIYEPHVYKAAFHKLREIHSASSHMTYTDFGIAMPLVPLKKQGNMRFLVKIAPRSVKNVLAPIHWACDYLDYPPITAMVVHSVDLQPGSSCEGTYQQAKTFNYDFEDLGGVLNTLLSRPEILKTMFRNPVDSRQGRREQLKGLLCPK